MSKTLHAMHIAQWFLCWEEKSIVYILYAFLFDCRLKEIQLWSATRPGDRISGKKSQSLENLFPLAFICFFQIHDIKFVNDNVGMGKVRMTKWRSLLFQQIEKILKNKLLLCESCYRRRLCGKLLIQCVTKVTLQQYLTVSYKNGNRTIKSFCRSLKLHQTKNPKTKTIKL